MTHPHSSTLHSFILMKYLVPLLVLSVRALVAACDGAPRISLSNDSAQHTGSIGAAYVMTNMPIGNYLVSATIGTDGKLALYEATYTGGKGAHGLPAPPGLDPLFSQGSIGVSRAQRYVATVNAGSNTVTVLAIDPFKPGRLDMIGQPVWSGGEFPMSVAINEAGTRVCVVNGGKVNGVSCYNFDARKGLTPIKNSIRSLGLNQTTPATGPPNTTSHIIFSADEKQLIVSVKAAKLVVWDVNADGSLSKNFINLGGGVTPFGLTYIPGRDALFVADPGVGYDIFDLAAADPANAGVSVAVPGQLANCWSVYSRQSGNFYLLDPALSRLTEVSVCGSSLNSTTVQTYNLGTDGPLDSTVATVGKNDFIYTLAANASSITVLSVNGPGMAQVSQRLDIAGPASAANLPLNSTNLQGMAAFIEKWY
ncbi:hypothetical protein FB45DRAFT_73454 [Roridomyces roridus]|uniref:Uncharacterized protein n=1 Tax=Roridomyces roridus TaxID=1738132 RepID=A0AAD7BNM8_9AGAR|nr:hypothetical protein FB45DRAFT_73454 [Roridomyces roridus]